ncbi:pentapeptide repeat-containing protein, partial [Faecalibacterium sp. Marseille-P9590]|uniref:pentapeptide repeat-containing protein n=1 Tax=Faecalibacterium sp. Marseille-P9590 TaxID=2817017 RepID=UPI001A9B9B76
ADLRSADLSGSNLRSADLSGSTGIMSAIAFMDAHFERTKDGFIAYKTFGSSYHPNDNWKIEPGSVLSEVVNPDRTCSCGCGINVAPLGWVKDNATNGGRLSIWKVLIRWEWLMGIVVPFGSDGKVRCEKVELIEVVK